MRVSAAHAVARLLLAAALLAGWQATLQHPIEHVDEHGHFVHIGGMDGDDARGENDGEGGDPSDRLGELLAALGACAAAAQAVLAERFPDYPLPSRPVAAPRAAEAPPFLSQGPPATV